MKDDSFSVDVITRILSILSDEGNMKKTVLAGRARLNYSALIRYLKFLRTLRWIDSKDSDNLITITAIGRSFKKLLERSDGPSDLSEDSLERLLAFSSERNAADSGAGASGGAGRLLATGSVTETKKNLDSQSCLFCGNAIGKGRAVTRELDGTEYLFDKRECATLFMKFKDVYGDEFSP